MLKYRNRGISGCSLRRVMFALPIGSSNGKQGETDKIEHILHEDYFYQFYNCK